MKISVSFPILLILVITTIDSGTLLAQRTRIADLIEVSDGVEIKREGESQYNQLGRNTTLPLPLYRGDLLQAKKGSKAIVRCIANSITWRVPDDGLPRGVANVCSPPS